MLGVPGETREDAFKTMQMVKRMRRVMPSIAFFAPYPGSVLGYQITAEGKSLMTNENYHRFPHDEKVKGINYTFYHDLLAGRYDNEINAAPSELTDARDASSHALTELSCKPSLLYVFNMTNGKKKFAYGQSPEDALHIMESRLDKEEMSGICRDKYSLILPANIQEHVKSLG